MASKLTKVSVILESIADLKGIKAFNAGLNRVDAATKKIGPSLQFVKGVMGGLAAVGGIAGGALIGAGKAAMDYASSIQDAADQSGASTAAIQSLAYVAQQNGASLDEMNKALIQLTKASAEAAAGNEEAAAKFARLGIDAKAFAALRPEEQMERLGRAILGAGNEQEALAAAMDLVGAKNAPKLMAALRELGTEGFATIEEGARKAGVVMSDQMVRSLDQAQDRLETFKTRLTITAGEIVQTFLDIEKGYTGLPAALNAVSEAEAKNGPKSLQAAEARLKVAELYLKEGKTREAALNVKKADLTGAAFINGMPTATDRGGQIDAAMKKRRELAAAIAKAQAEEQAKAARQAANARKDAEERATVDAEAAKNKAAKEEIAAEEKAAEEKAADEALKVAQDNAEQLRAAQESAATGDRNELVKRGLALGGQDLTGGPAFTAPIMPEAPKAATPVVEFTIPKDLSVQGIDALKALLTSIDRRLAAGSAQPSFGD